MQNRFRFFIQEVFYRFFYISFSFFMCFIVCFINNNSYFFIMIKPLFFSFFQYSWNLIYLNPPDFFISSFYTSFFYSFLFCFPLFYLHFYFYFVTTCQKQVSVLFFLFIFISFFSLFSSYFISFFIFLPNLWSFFKYFEHTTNFLSFTFLPTVKPFIYFCFIIFISFIINFHIPIIFFFLFYKQLISFWSLFCYRNFIYFSFSCIATALSPPDMLSQIILIISLFVFFETYCFIILLFFFFNHLII